MEPLNLTPIGVYCSDQKYTYDAARQPREDATHLGEIRLESGHNFEQALQGLEGFDRIWVIFQFHHNEHWKPMVFPPRGTSQKVGVFATRAPYRPNSLGLSCLRLVDVEGLKLIVEGADLLDGTPILDIKPYLTDSDSFPEARRGWLENIENREWTLRWNEDALKRLTWLEEQEPLQLRSFVEQQLQYEPFDDRRKRVEALPDRDQFLLAYRTWRILFRPVADQALEILTIFSGYSEADLSDSSDKWKDKDLHRKFNGIFAKPSLGEPKGG